MDSTNQTQTAPYFPVKLYPEVAGIGVTCASIFLIIIIVNVTRHLSNWGPKWYGFFVAVAVSAGAWYFCREQATATVSWQQMSVVAFLNGLINYASAFGVQTAVIAPSPKGGPGDFLNEERLRFRSQW